MWRILFYLCIIQIYIFLQLAGCNLLKLIHDSQYEGLPLRQVKRITRQVLQGLAYLHEKCQIIHTDIKPENVLVALSPGDVIRMADTRQQQQQRITNMAKHACWRINVKIADLGNACWTVGNTIKIGWIFVAF